MMNEQKALTQALAEPEAPAAANLALLPPAQRAAVALESSRVETDLRALVAKSVDVVVVLDPAGREQAHRMGMNLKNARVAIGHKVEAVTEDAKLFAKATKTEAERLIGIITDEEERVFKLRDDYDDKVRAEKEEAEKRNRERIATVEREMAALRSMPGNLVGKSAEVIASTRAALILMVPSEEVFFEYLPRAREIHAEVLAQIDAALVAQQAVEAEAERVRAEAAAEAERVAAQAEQNRILAAELQRQREAMEAEQARIAAESAERERVAADARRAEEKAMTDRLAAQKAEIDRCNAELKQKQDEFTAQQRLREQAAEDERRKQESALQQLADSAAQPQLPGVEVIEDVDLAPFMPKSDHSLRVLVDRDAHFPAPTGSFALSSTGALEIVEGKPDYSAELPNGQRYSTTTFKDNGEPILLNADGSRSVFCDLCDDMPLAVAYDEAADVLTVDGIDYAGSMFRRICAMVQQQKNGFVPPALAVREDGVIVVAG